MFAKSSLIAAVAVAALAAGCGTSASPASDSSGHKLQVVTAFYPFQFVAEQVAGDRAEVSTLTSPGSEPHDLELAPKQVASLAEADLVVYQTGFQANLDKAIGQASPKASVDVAKVVTMLPSSGAEEGGDAHETSATDPHEWLLPSNMVKVTRAVEQQLSTADPADAATFKTNADALVGRLEALDASFSSGLKNCQRTEFITSHAAFQYLAKQYGLTQIGISGLSPDEEPSPARIAQVQQLAKQHGITTIFYETLVSPAQAKAMAGDLGLKTDVLDPLEGITDASRGSDYIAVQQSNLKALQSANGCR